MLNCLTSFSFSFYFCLWCRGNFTPEVAGLKLATIEAHSKSRYCFTFVFVQPELGNSWNIYIILVHYTGTNVRNQIVICCDTKCLFSTFCYCLLPLKTPILFLSHQFIEYFTIHISALLAAPPMFLLMFPPTRSLLWRHEGKKLRSS